jgi:hypothetical protein
MRSLEIHTIPYLTVLEKPIKILPAWCVAVTSIWRILRRELFTEKELATGIKIIQIKSKIRG